MPCSSMSVNNTLNKLEEKIAEIEFSSENKRDFAEIKKLVRANLNQKDSWDTFIHKFEDVYPNFFEKIKSSFDGLTVNQLKICAYIKVGMDNKEIATVTHTELGSG